MICEVESLAKIARKICVRYANLLGARVDIIPPILFHSLLLTAIETNRVLSIRTLLSSWPLEEICLANCVEFKPEHATMMAHCLQMGCDKLRRIDLSGCNIGPVRAIPHGSSVTTAGNRSARRKPALFGRVKLDDTLLTNDQGVQGTKLFLKLATGKGLPNIHEYGMSNGQSQDVFKADSGIAEPFRLHLQTDCYIDQGNFPLFMEVLNNLAVLDFKVSCLHAVELGPKRIKRLLKKMQFCQAQFIVGLNFEMNGLRYFEDCNLVTMSTSSSHATQLDIPSEYCFTAFKSFYQLKYLNLSGNIIGLFVVVMILKNIPDKAYLTHLALNSCNIGSKRDYFDQISNFHCVQKLEHLELANNRLDNVNNLLELFYKCCHTLFYLNLERNIFRRDSLPAIQKLLKNPFHLKELSIGKNLLSSHDMQQLDTSHCHVKF